MAPHESAIIIGIDVCKDTLDIFEHARGRADSIGNDATSIKTWLDGKEGCLQLVLEPTNRYHEAVAEAAYARGHDVYWIDPYRLSHSTGPGSSDGRRPILRALADYVSRAREERPIGGP
jgi:transposase